MTFSPVRKSKRQCAKCGEPFARIHKRATNLCRPCWSIRSLDVALKAKGVVR